MKYKIFFTIILASLIDVKSDHYDILDHKKHTINGLCYCNLVKIFR
jgi:hypothetical protein